MTYRSIPRARRALGRPRAILLALVTGLALAGLASMAAAATRATLATASNQVLGEKIVVDGHGLTVYELSHETVHHLLCTKANGCLQIWRPVTVASAKTKLTAVRGVTSKLTILRRDGFSQVVLGGHPLYRFVGDRSQPGVATGQGLQSFGGTWHAVLPSGAGAPVSTPATTAPAPTPTTPTMPTTPTTPPTPTTPYYPPLGL